MKTLFIGGPVDGQMIDILPNVEFMDVPERLLLAPSILPSYEAQTFVQVKYGRQRIRAEREWYSVMVALGDNRDVIQQLIEGYRN